MKNWQAFAIVFAILELTYAVRKLNPHPTEAAEISTTIIGAIAFGAFCMGFYYFVRLT